MKDRRFCMFSFLVGVLGTISPVSVNAQYADVILADEPTAYWRLDDLDGSEVKDSSGNDHHGAVDGVEGSIAFGRPGLVSKEIANGSISLAGFDRIIIPGFEKIGDAGFSAEYWVRVTEYPTACCDSLVSDGESGGDFFMMNYLLGPGQGDNGGIRSHFSFANAPVSTSQVRVFHPTFYHPLRPTILSSRSMPQCQCQREFDVM